jgi:micrococcal nuclease
MTFAARRHPRLAVGTVAAVGLVGGTALLLAWATRARGPSALDQATQVRHAEVAVDPTAARVARAIDGDTIELADRTIVRYIGIDTPELNAPLGRVAAEMNRALVEGHNVRLEFESLHRDRYGRTLAHVWIGDRLVAEELATQGMGSTALFATNLRHSARLLAAQETARRSGRGIWAQPLTPPVAAPSP